MAPEDKLRLNTIAIIGALIAIFGLVLVLVADRMYTGVENDYLTTDMTYEEFIEALDLIDAISTVGIVALAVAIIVVAISVPINETRSMDKMRKRLEEDFYRKCPSCGSWNTKFVPNCTTCGILMPKLAESTTVEPRPMVFKEPPK